ncbi:chloride channel protein [Actinophytocola sp.]|uniref:chloride channel protein n=1 Tax=Actinophytocola sp. TaxID=1872138 RepID=UPI002ED8153B
MTRLAPLALATGAGSGLAAAALSLLVDGVTGAAQHGGVFLVAAPVLGGLGYGLLVHLFAPRTRGLGIPELMLAVAGSGEVGARAAVVRTIGAALCVGTGGSLGREGPAVVAGSAIGSALGRRAGVAAPEVRVLIGCGVVAATAVIFDAPVTGVVFALELFLARTLAAEITGVADGGVVDGGPAPAPPKRPVAAWCRRARSAFVVLSPVVGLLSVAGFAAAAVRLVVLGTEPFLDVRPGEVALTAALGLGAVCGLVGAGFGALVYVAEDLVDRVWRGPPWLRPAAGGVLLGLLLLALPRLYGMGSPVIGEAAAGTLPLALLLVLAAGKAVAAGFTLAIGGVGGVLIPLLFVGTMLGAAWGTLSDGSTSGYALVGMAAVLAGAARIPATAVMLTVELSGQVMPAVVGAALVAAGISRLVSPGTVFTRKLLRRGIRW